MKENDNSIFEQNYCIDEYFERHTNAESHPRQKALKWNMWDDLVTFFKGYFNYFGDDISGLDDATFKKVIKTIWRFCYVASSEECMEYQQRTTPSFVSELKQHLLDIDRHNRNEPDELYGYIGLARDVLDMDENKLNKS